MVLMEQGENYEESTQQEEPGYDETEANEDTSSLPDTIYGIPRGRFVIIVVFILLVVIGAIVAFKMTRRPASVPSEPADDVLDDTYYEDEDLGFGDEIIVDDTTMVDVPMGTTTATATIEDISTQQQIELRKHGYSGDEISFALEQGFDVDALIEAAVDLETAAQKEAIKRLSDTAGPEYKYLLNYTYLGQDEQPLVSQSDLPLEEQISYTETVVLNTDFVKCPLNGMQLYLKCKYSGDTYIWYQVTPQRYLDLPESGNIVLQLQLHHYGDSTYVVGITELDGSLSTVDSTTGN